MSQDLAYIHPGAKIGHSVRIEPFTYIADQVVIGDHCQIGPNVTIKSGTTIGNNCQVYPGAVIGGEPQDLKFQGEESTITIGNDVIIRECVTINRGTALDRGNTQIGNQVVLMAYTHIAHDCVIGDHAILANSVQMAGHVHIGEYAFIGGTTAVHQFVKIGGHSMISGGSLVRKDVPPYVTAARDPLSYMGVNSIGLRRRGYSNEKINELQDIYRIFYVSGLNNSDALEKIKTELKPTLERDQIIRFIEDSSRGLMRGGQD
ncbi:acyl-ACP--UDP-N-acetylglucosamine O-acyltransferase [Marinoscillum sp.]|uniref:acyl-ACP--UDP-N-acetylglucosamine O-acyltransferase n=1 Tax=Marinoscillum sp. TaxID=2024838 RepID=UPI003BA932A6